MRSPRFNPRRDPLSAAAARLMVTVASARYCSSTSSAIMILVRLAGGSRVREACVQTVRA
jgi:hypothetical protein